nr:nonstructural protein 1 [Psittaciform chaphamaparvovirus 4]
MERSGDSVRVYQWMGRSGGGSLLTSQQASAYLVPMEVVAMPMPEVEKQFKLLDMKQHVCGIVQICDSSANPLEMELPYCMLFNQLTSVTRWLATGEFNADGVFHVHVLLQTSQRSDAVRRSIANAWNILILGDAWKELCDTAETVDCLKLQKCFKPSSMCTYLIKNPVWICSNNDTFLELGVSARIWNLHDRFVKQTEKPETSPQMNAMTKEIVDIIVCKGCKTLEDLFRADNEAMSKYLHRPGLDAIVRNCLSFVKATGGGWSLVFYEKFHPEPGAIHQVLLHQGIEPSQFDRTMYLWLTKSDSKRNTILIQGPSNTGKSAFISGLKASIPWGEIVNTNSGFAFEGLLENVIGIWEEPLCGPELAEKAKQVLEGMTTSIPVKYKKPQMLPRTPIFITTNHPLWRFCTNEEPMFRNRMWIYEFKYQCKDQPFTCRACEYSCKCSYCEASRGGTLAHGEPSPIEVPSGDESVSTGELGTVRPDETAAMGTGSVSGTDGRAKRGNDRKRGRSSSRAKKQRSDRAGRAGSTSPAAKRCLGGATDAGPSDPGNGDDSTESGSGQRLESNDSARGHGDAGSSSPGRAGGNGNGGGGKHKFKSKHLERIGPDIRKHDRVSKLGFMEAADPGASQIPVSTQQCSLDRFLAPMKLSLQENITIPTKESWQSYLAYLFQTYKDG